MNWVIGIAGGSGSGKTTLAKKLISYLGNENCTLISQDSYYIDQSHNFDRDGGSVNFDHPGSLELKLLADHIFQLKYNNSVQVPIYDFASHKRLQKTTPVNPNKIIIVDGILIFSEPKVREQLDELIFLDVDEQTRFERRLKRDVAERGRTPDGVKVQFFNQVKPMHDQFVEPSKAYATILFRGKDFVINKKSQNEFHLKTIAALGELNDK